MNNKSHFISVLLMFLSLPLLKAQNISFGVQAGPSTRNISYGSYNIFRNPNVGANLGVISELRFSELFSIEPMLTFSAQGSKDGAFVSPINYNTTQYPNDVKFGELNYLMIPVLAKLGWNLDDRARIRFFVNAGPYAAILLSANQVLVTPDQQKIAGTSINAKPGLNNFNAGLDGNIGLSYYFSFSSIFVQAGGNYGLLIIQKDQSEGGNYAGAATLAIGYTFWIDNNFHNNGHFSPVR